MIRVRDVMERDVTTLATGDTLDIADDVMRLGRVRHFPVLSGGTLVGVLSQRDLYRAAASSLLQLSYGASRSLLAEIPVEAVASTTVHAIAPDRPLRDAVNLMLREKIGCLPVVENGALVGIVSETDCLRHLAALLAHSEEPGTARDVPL